MHKSHYENVPFDIPNNWRWVKLGDIAEKIGSGSTPRGGRAVYQSYGVVFIRSQNVYNGGLYLDDVAYITDEINEQMAGTQVQPNDILLNITGASIGRSAIVPSDLGKANVNQHVSIIRLDERQFQPFVHKVLISDYIQSIIKNVQVGAAQEGLPAEKQKEMLIPLPPLAEQHRILTAIESSFAFIDEIEQNKFDLQAAVTATKSKILSIAIRGKLIPQDPNDEPASVLLDRIRAEREKLIKAGKIKRNKSDSVIVMSDDNSYYDELPQSWELATLGTLSTTIQYGLSNTAEEAGSHRLLRITDIQDNRVVWGDVPFTTITDRQAEEFSLKTNDIVFARTGATVGKSYLISELEEPSVFASYLIRVQVIGVFPKFVKRFFECSFYWTQIVDKSVGIGQPNVNGTKLRDLILPIPPLAEQRRIVAAIESAFAELDNIATQLI